MNKTNFPIYKILILVTILAVPGFLYYLLQAKGKNRYNPLPIYGPKTVLSTFKTKRGKKIPDTLFHKIPDFRMKNQDNKMFDFSTDTNKIYVVNFFYVGSKTVGLRMNERVKWLQDRYLKNKIIKFISISVDPKDSVTVLKNYAKKLNAKVGKWDFLSADTNTVYPLARKGFLVDAFYTSDPDNEYVFSDKLILIDAPHRIRGYYSSTSVSEITRLDDEIKVLITEELRKIKAEF